MAEKNFETIYREFRKNYFRNVINNMGIEKGLSMNEIFSTELIYLLNKPTISTFANVLKVSQPNATYKIRGLIAKGYVTKINSETDHREFALEVTDKYLDIYAGDRKQAAEAENLAKEKLSEEDYENLVRILGILVSEEA